MKGFIPLICSALILYSACALNAQDLSEIMPGENALDKWKVIEGPRILVGDELFDLINGGADIYYEYGFIQVLAVDYMDPAQNHIQLEIYEMSDPGAAYGIFSLSQQAVEWGSDYGLASAVTSGYIAFCKSRFYVIISWASRQHADNPPLSFLAGIVDGKILEKGDFPGLVRDLKVVEPSRKTVYMRGNLALSNFYYFDYKDIFEIVEGIACAKESHHRILFRYADEPSAARLLSSAKLAMMNNKRFTDIAVIYQGYTCRDNKGNRIMVRQMGRYLALLVALNPEVALAPLMDEIMHKIEVTH